MFRVRHFLLVSTVAFCCVAQFVVHACHDSGDPLASISPAAMAQTPDLEIQAKGKDKNKDKVKPNNGPKLAAALCIAAMRSGLAGSMDARVLAQYCVDMALELMGADYSLEP